MEESKSIIDIESTEVEEPSKFKRFIHKAKPVVGGIAIGLAMALAYAFTTREQGDESDDNHGPDMDVDISSIRDGDKLITTIVEPYKE